MNTEEISLGEHFFAEKRGEKEYAILHTNGGLHMADICEVAMIESIARLQAQVVELAFLVQTAPMFFSAHSFGGEKLLWLKRAGLVPKGAK